MRALGSKISLQIKCYRQQPSWPDSNVAFFTIFGILIAKKYLATLDETDNSRRFLNFMSKTLYFEHVVSACLFLQALSILTF